MQVLRDERFKQVAVGVVVLAIVLVVTLGVRLASFLPGIVGDFFGIITGILSTPIMLEISFFTIGLMIVFAINHWRMKRDGDEFVYLDQIPEPEALNLPDHAKFAIYQTPPLPGEEPSLLAQAEGAVEIGDYDAASAALEAMTDAELHLPDTTALRIRLARATGHENLARRLENAS